MQNSSLTISIILSVTYLISQTTPLSFYDLTISFGIAQTQGRKTYMEDFFNANLIHPASAQQNKYLLFAVYDGHGGNEVSTYLQEQFPTIFADYQEKHKTHKALKRSLATIEKNIQKKDLSGGSTALVAVLNKDKQLHVAHVGDSRAIIIRDRSIIFRTEDHKPNHSREKRRINKAGSSVTTRCKTPRVQGLAMSRSLGDTKKKSVHPGAITARPNVSMIHVQPGDTLIMASDGLWDVLPDDFSTLLAYLKTYYAQPLTRQSALKQAALLKDYAYQKGSKDNITVIVAHFDA